MASSVYDMPDDDLIDGIIAQARAVERTGFGGQALAVFKGEALRRLAMRPKNFGEQLVASEAIAAAEKSSRAGSTPRPAL